MHSAQIRGEPVKFNTAKYALNSTLVYPGHVYANHTTSRLHSEESPRTWLSALRRRGVANPSCACRDTNCGLQNILEGILEIFYHSECLQAADGPRQGTLREAAMSGTMLVPLQISLLSIMGAVESHVKTRVNKYGDNRCFHPTLEEELWATSYLL